MTADLNNISNPRVWVLIDNRTGNANQALAFASYLHQCLFDSSS
jgi:mitochondrial fission protein ELM1